jgi:hypothetical protein
MKKLLFAILFSLSFLTQASNGWVSSGGDNAPKDIGAAWFIGDEPVRYCIESAANFSVSSANLISIIDQSASKWKKYYDNHAAFILNKNIHPNFNLLSIATCNGSEDIKFSFGTNTPEISVLKNSFYDPYGFATLKSYDVSLGRGKGIVWIADPAVLYPAADPIALNTMILHELGHVFGNGHSPLTIMDEHITEAIANTGPLAGYPIGEPSVQNAMTSIDGKNQLFFHYAGIWNIPGYVPFDNANPTILSAQQSLLGQFFNRPIIGSVTGSLENLGPSINYVLHLKDNAGSVTVKIPGPTDSSAVATKNELFKTFSLDPASKKPVVNFETSKAWTMFSSFTTPRNEVIPMTINLYTDDYFPVHIRFFYQGRFISIFKSGEPPRFGAGVR